MSLACTAHNGIFIELSISTLTLIVKCSLGGAWHALAVSIFDMNVEVSWLMLELEAQNLILLFKAYNSQCDILQCPTRPLMCDHAFGDAHE